MVYFFVRFSFLHEFITAKSGLDTHLSLILYSLCYLAALLSGGALRAFRSKVTWIWLLFAFSMCLAAATSFWRGASFTVLSDYLRTALPLLFVIPALTYTADQVNKLLNTIGIAGIATVILGACSDNFRTGRLSLDSFGTIGNSNDFAAHLIFVLPAIAFLAFAQRRNLFVKISASLIIGVGLFQILSTGSRGGLISVIVTLVYLLYAGSRKIKLAILIGAPALSLFAVPLLPHQAALRLESLFNSNVQTDEASSSEEGRLTLLRASVAISFEHPLLGVGPGVFMDYQGNVATQNGERGLWHVSHNSYTQVSSECGIPALILYLCALAVTFAYLRKAAKFRETSVAGPAQFVAMMMVGFCTTMIFLSVAYTLNLLVISGLMIALTQIMREPSVMQQVPAPVPL